MSTGTNAILEERARAFAALGQMSRLRIVHLLTEAGSEGLAAGEIAQRLNLSQNGSSTHLSILAQSGLVKKRQVGKRAFYALDDAALTRLLGSLQPASAR